MRRYLLDSIALNQFVFRRSGVYERAIETRKQGAIIGTCTPVVAEILGGTRYSQTSEVNLPRVEQILKQLKVWAFDIAAAHEYGRIYSELRRTGIQMQVIDRMIAATAITIPNCTVITSDSDFARVGTLNIENWAK